MSATPQPKMSDLLVRFLNKQAQVQGEGFAEPSLGGEVVPFEASPLQPIDPKLAWEEALTAVSYFQPGIATKKWPVPPQWGSLVAAQEPALALAFCLGNYPQLVRNFHLLLQKSNPAAFTVSPGRPLAFPALIEWAGQVAAKKEYPHLILALAILRLANHFGEAQAFVKAHEATVPQEWQAAWKNEKAALAWHQGETQEARSLWNTMEPNVPVLFNRGMAEVFLGNLGPARVALKEAVAKISPNSSWHHLAGLYLALSGKS